MGVRNYKFGYSFYNMFKRSQLKHNLPLYKKHGIKKTYFSPISSRDFDGLDEKLNWLDVEDSAKVLPGNPKFEALDQQTKDSIINWSRDGYVILRDHLTSDEVAEVNQHIQDLLDSGKVSFRYGNKIMFAINVSELLWKIGTSSKLKGVLELLLGKDMELFQSINFIEASQQRTHSDSIHMTTFPRGNLAAVWIALEDMSAENGALHYYPGSHRLPYLFNKDYDNEGTALKLGPKSYTDYEDEIEKIIEQKGLKKEVFTAKSGDLLIWHANLLHGGEPLQDPERTRKSMALHYYSQGVVCYHEITQRPALIQPRPDHSKNGQ